MFDIREHLLTRRFLGGLYRGVTIDRVNCKMTVMLWNLSGMPIGYQTYSPLLPKDHKGNPRNQKYFTYVTPGCMGVWGLESLTNSKQVIYLVEGIFEASRLHAAGFTALATLGSDPKHLKSWLRTLPNKKVAICQGDKAGDKLAKYGDATIQVPGCMDLADLPPKNFIVFMHQAQNLL